MINEARLLDTFLALARIDSPTGEEAAIAAECQQRLQALGLTVECDAMHNLIARLPGDGEPLLLAAHMDTVMPGCNVQPVIRDGIVYSDGTTVLGADDKSGVALILEVLQAIVAGDLPHPPLEVALTAQEEAGLLGAREVQPRLVARRGISFDVAGPAGKISIGAPWSQRFKAVVHGRAAHAGSQPEQGISAILVAAEALTRMPLGLVDAATTANIGLIQGGTSVGIIPDRAELQGAVNSRSAEALIAQVQAMTGALQAAASSAGAKVDIDTSRAFDGFCLNENDPIVRALVEACQAQGVAPQIMLSRGGSDPNVYNAFGIRVASMGIGAYMAHGCEEYLVVRELVQGAHIALHAATHL